MGIFDQSWFSGRTQSGLRGVSGPEALIFLEEGRAFEKEGQLDLALERYELALRLDPDLGQAHFYRGNILLDKGDARAALEDYVAALLHKPDSAATHYNIGNAHAYLGQHAVALIAYKKALEVKSDFTDAEAALGATYEELGQLDAAVECYRRALALKPDYLEVHLNLGAVLIRLEHYVEAAACYRRALVISPTHVGVLGKLALALKASGQLEAAVTSYRDASAVDPKNVNILGALGDFFVDLGRLEEAIASYRQALEIDPSCVEVLNNLGAVQKELGRFDEAMASYRRAVESSPDVAEPYNNLGVILKLLGRFDEAVKCYHRALEIKPDFAEVHSNLGAALKDLGRIDAALASYRRALEIKPDFAEAHYNLGASLQELVKFHEALESYRRALAIQPDYAEALNNSGVVLLELGQFDNAVATFRRALDVSPHYVDAHMNLGSVLKDLGRFEESMASTRRALEIDPECANAHDNLLFIHNYLSDQPSALLRAEAERYGEMVSRHARPYTSWSNIPDPDRCLRVGLVSGDLCNHPVGYFIEAVLTAISSQAVDRVELFAYPCRASVDATSKRIRACCRGWSPAIGLSDEALAQRIYADQIDILIDLSGHTAHNRLPMFAWKPAPVQVSWLGYFATTGLPAIDYFVADPWTLPASQEGSFTENIWRLPETRLCFTPPDVEVAVSPLPALSNQFVTFGCFNNLSKMNAEVVALWARILNAVPGSRLFLLAPQFKENTVVQTVVDRFGDQGVAPARLELEAAVPRADYLAAYQRIDIALDPFPFPGGTTTMEALWMGVPVLTLAGERFLSRQGVGLMMNAELPEWVAKDKEDYLNKAVSLAMDWPQLSVLRTSLRQQVLASPVFDAPRFAQHFEEAIRGMWNKWCVRRG